MTYENLIETAQNPFFLTDSEGRILAANTAAANLFGFLPEEARLLRRDNLFDTGDGRLACLLEERRRTGRARGEATAVLPDGTRFACDCSSMRFLTLKVKSATVRRSLIPVNGVMRNKPYDPMNST